MLIIANAFCIMTLLYSTLQSAGVYRWVDENGQVHFTDRRSQEVLQRNIPDTDTHPSQYQAEVTPQSEDLQMLGPYSAFELVLPGENEILIQEVRDLSIAIILDPPLIDGHIIDIVLDERIVSVKSPANQFKLTGAAYGSHRLQIRIRNAKGVIIAQTPFHFFHLSKPKHPGQLP